MLMEIAMLISFLMSVFLFLVGYKEAITISRASGLVNGGTMIFCFVMGLIFAIFANTFSSNLS
ncbi:hypothetical protein ACFSCX_20255 [Bacillus salitolerans]|uniref:Uncharacterized protein n=1 Tax=Bacillus salitolerans TaxID=1437434 RepID=A0ABW4LWR6_9BACI